MESYGPYYILVYYLFHYLNFFRKTSRLADNSQTETWSNISESLVKAALRANAWSFWLAFLPSDRIRVLNSIYFAKYNAQECLFITFLYTLSTSISIYQSPTHKFDFSIVFPNIIKWHLSLFNFTKFPTNYIHKFI